MIKVENLCAGYGKNQVLHEVNLTAKAGEIVTVIGHNGCGKSTLLKTLLGFHPMTSGDILLNGTSIRNLSAGHIAKLAAYLPQTKFVADISVGRLVLHGRFPYLSYPRKYRKSDFEVARRAMEQMGIEDLAEYQLSELSGGMRQKAYIAMALAQEAPVIVMDEPTTYLDIGQQFKFTEIVSDLARNGKTVLLVLHDVLLALMISDHIVAMQNGRVIKTGTPDEILHSDILYSIYGVNVRTVMTENGLQYYYERNTPSCN